MLWKVEFRKHIGVVGSLGAVVLAAGLARIVWAVEALKVVYGLSVLVTWTALVCYVAFSLFSYYCLGRDLALHIATRSRRSILVVKAAVLYTLMVAFHFLVTALDLPDLRRAPGWAWADLAYIVGARAVSLAAFIATVLLFSLMVKGLSRKVPMMVAFATSIVALIVAQGILLWAMRTVPDADWFVGISGVTVEANSYANVLPIVVSEGGGFVSTVALRSILPNVLVAGLASALWWFGVGRYRTNFLQVK